MSRSWARTGWRMAASTARPMVCALPSDRPIGDRVVLAVDTDSIHLFSPDSGKRLNRARA